MLPAPWPFFIGPQVKLHNFTASFEIGLNNGVSGFSGIIATIGYRRPLRGKRWILKKSEKFKTIYDKSDVKVAEGEPDI